MKTSRVLLALALLAFVACSLAMASDGYHKKKAGGGKQHHDHGEYEYPSEDAAEVEYRPAKPVAPKAPKHMTKPVAPKHKYDDEDGSEEELEEEAPSHSAQDDEEDEAYEHTPAKEHKPPVKEHKPKKKEQKKKEQEEEDEQEDDGEEEQDDEKDEEEEAYDSYDDDKPACGPKQFLTLPVCVDPSTGVCNKIPGASKYYRSTPGACNTTSTQWCKSVNSKWCCCYSYRPATYTCRAQAGVCDQAETCTGTGPDCPADVIAPAGTSCGTKGPKVCYKAPVCDGAGKTAASCKTRKVRNGTPCRTEGSPYAGLYQQVVAESSASIASVTPESSSVLAEPEAMKKHGWMQCHRCYHGHCTEFKYEYWSKINGGKKMYKDAYNGKDYEEGKQPSGYKPGLTCHKMHDGEAEEDEY